MIGTYQHSYKNLKDLVHEMKGVGLNGFDVSIFHPPNPFGTPGDRETHNITGTKIVVPPPFNGGEFSESRWYNDGQSFGLQLNDEGQDEPENPWVNIRPSTDIWTVIEPVIFHKITVRCNDEIGGLTYPVHLWIFQDPQFINQINAFMEGMKK